MSVQVRLMGEPDDINQILAALTSAGLDVASSGKQYPNRSGFGVRVYTEVRISEPGPVKAQAERTDTPPRKRVTRSRRELGPGGSK